MRVLRRRGLLLVGIFVSLGRLIYVGTSQLPKRYSSVAWIKINDDIAGHLQRSRQVGRPHQRAASGHPQPAVTEAQRVRPRQAGAKFKDVKSVTSTGLEASPLIRIDSSASSPQIAERSADAASEYARQRASRHCSGEAPRTTRIATTTPRRSSPLPSTTSATNCGDRADESQVRVAEGEARGADRGTHRGREEGLTGALERGHRRRWTRDLRDRVAADRAGLPQADQLGDSRWTRNPADFGRRGLRQGRVGRTIPQW